MNDLIVQERSLFKASPKDQVRFATEIANELAPIIDKQGMYVNIQGKKYIKCEAWQTLGTFLGIIPRERFVTRLEDGSYEAGVDLIRYADGVVVGGSSAICSVNEKRWGNADEYARRSMAVTRAVSKAYRTAFAWIVTLAGYQPTPAEEMQQEEDAPKVYDGSTKQQKKMLETLKGQGVDEKYYGTIHEKMMGRPAKDFGAVVKEVTTQ